MSLSDFRGFTSKQELQASRDWKVKDYSKLLVKHRLSR